jgi:asparagine synthase (glutamine-hydrolysing)
VNERKETTAHYVTPSQEGFLDDLSNLVWHQEEPFTTTSIYAQYCIMREAQRNGVTVILDGQGADEVLCGYRKFTVYYLQQLLRERRIAKLAGELFALARHGDRGLLNFVDAQRYLPASLRRRTPGIERVLTDAMAWDYAAATSAIAQRGDVSDRQKLDLDHYSVPSLLRYEDRNSMAFSIESRVPFLDYRLVDWALQLPAGIKIANGQSKAVLRNAMRGAVPD